MKSLVIASLLVPTLALAQPKTADDWYKEGETQYNLGEFDKAADAFKQGFASETVDSKKPAYLYNVAQAYRQANKCKDAAFFYKRYLSLKDQDTAKPLKAEKRAEIEARIVELEECAKTQQTIASKPPNNTLSPNSSTSTATKPAGGATPAGGTNPTVATGGSEGEVDEGEGEDEDEGDGEGVTETATFEHPKLISARFEGGGAKINAGDLNFGIKPSFALTAGYPVLAKDQLLVEAGAVFGLTPVPYKNTITMEQKRASLISVLANGAATYTVAPKIGIRGDLGVGILAFTGISEMGNVFTEGGASTSGALTMLQVRVAVSGDYSITQNLVATLTPVAFSYSPPKDGLREDISAITRIDFMVGLGYRM